WSRRDRRTGRDVIFGLPHSVQPVTLSYRADLFAEAGLDPTQARTWSELQSLFLQFQNYWAAHGRPSIRAMELPVSSVEIVLMMLLQRHINIMDARDVVHLADAPVADTVAFYAQMVAGGRSVGGPSAPGANFWAKSFADGDVAAMATPNWRAGYVQL